MIQPPGRIEQLNNFQDSIQSPDGLDRLRALQYIEQVLPSSQGLMGMPQVQAPAPQMQPQVPVMARQYGGEVGTGGLVGLTADGMQIFDNSQEGALNRATHGGILEGYNYTPSTGGTGTAGEPVIQLNDPMDAPGTLAAGGANSSYGSTLPKSAIQGTDLYNMPTVQSRGGIYNVSDFVDSGTFIPRPSDAPETIPARDRPQTKLRDPQTGKIPWGAYVPQDVVTFGQGYDLKDVDYFTANAIAAKDGAERFIYNNEYARTDGGLLSNYDYSNLGTKPWAGLENKEKIRQMTTGMYAGGVQVQLPQSMTSPSVMRAKGYVAAGRPVGSPGGSGTWSYQGINPERRKYLGQGVYANYKHGGQITARQYGGEVGTGGLLRVAEDGTQIFDRTEEGALNRAVYGGVLEGYDYTPNTGGTATSTPITTNSLDAPGTLASGTTAPSSSIIGDTTGTQDYYDLNYAAQAIGQDTFMYGDKLMQTDGGYLRGGPMNPYISNKVPEDQIINPHLYSSYQSGNPHAYNISNQRKPDIYNPGFYSLPSSTPIGEFAQDVSTKYSYYDANQAAQEAGSPTFMYGDKLMQTDAGYLQGGNINPYISNQVPAKWTDAGVQMGYLTGAHLNASPKQIIMAQPNTPQGIGWEDSGRRYVAEGPHGTKRYFAGGGQITAREGGGQVDPAQAAEGLASFGRYGDNILVHMNPEELDGLASLGKITYNPVTGLPEAFSFGKIFKGLRKLAPIILAVAAPHIFGATTALGIGASTAAGSFFGNMIAGAKPGDALKSGLMSGLFAGGGAYMGGAPSGFGGAAGSGVGGAGASTAGAGLSKAGGAMYGSTAGVAPSAGTSALSAGISGPGLSGTGQAMYGSTPTFGPPVGSQFTPSMGDISSSLAQGRPPLQLANPNIGNPMVPRIGQNVNVGGQSFANASEFNPYQNALPGGADPRVMEMGAIDPPASAGSEFTGSQYSNEGLPNAIAGPDGAGSVPSVGDPYGNQTVVRPDKVSLFKDQTPSNINRILNELKTEYSTKEGLAKLVAMDMSTPDWESQYAAEAAAKNQQLQDAGYTVETGFNGQTVIRDSSGVVMPRNLTPQMILDRALGKAPRTNLVARYGYGPKESKEGGLISLKHGGEFSGMVPGQGHGMEDNVYMPIVEKGHGSQVGTLAVSPSEYVVDSYTMAALGNGNADAGAKVMDNVVKHVRKKAYGNTKQPNEISGLRELEPMIERV